MCPPIPYNKQRCSLGALHPQEPEAVGQTHSTSQSPLVTTRGRRPLHTVASRYMACVPLMNVLPPRSLQALPPTGPAWSLCLSSARNQEVPLDTLLLPFLPHLPVCRQQQTQPGLNSETPHTAEVVPKSDSKLSHLMPPLTRPPPTRGSSSLHAQPA